MIAKVPVNPEITGRTYSKQILFLVFVQINLNFSQFMLLANLYSIFRTKYRFIDLIL